MSNDCDHRNRPGFVDGDVTAHLPDRPMVTAAQAEGLRTVLLAGFSTAMIVAVVFSMVLFAE